MSFFPEKTKKSLSSLPKTVRETDHLLHLLFKFFDRFSPTFARFFQKEFPYPLDTVTIELESVEKRNGQSFEADPIAESSFFITTGESESASPIYLEIEKKLLALILDALLGSSLDEEAALSEEDTEFWSETDRVLASLFIHRFCEIFAEITGRVLRLFTPEEIEFIPAPSIDSSFVYYSVLWKVVLLQKSFLLAFHLPPETANIFASSALAASEAHSSENSSPGMNLSRLIEERRNGMDLFSRENPLGQEKSDLEPSLQEAENISAFAPGVPSEVEIRVLAGQLEIALSDLIRLAPGDLLLTDIPVLTPFQVLLDETPLFLGRPGKDGENPAVQILGDVPSRSADRQ